jgi:hypothetical protein
VAAVETNPGGVAHDVSSQPNDTGVHPPGDVNLSRTRRSRKGRRRLSRHPKENLVQDTA